MKKAKQKILRGLATGGAVLCMLSVFSLFSGCTGNTAPPAGEQPRLVATTTMLADLARTIGGEHLTVTGLMGPGIDPHLYQAGAGDVDTMQNADIVLYNGLHLEGKMGELFASLTESGKTVICASDGISPDRLLADEETPGAYDPHIWFDVSLWEAVAVYTAERLAEADPAHRAAYEANLLAYRAELGTLADFVQARAAELPAEQRVLITAHDAFRYFGRAYGFEVRGLQGINTDAEAGTADVSALAAFIAENRIRAVFVESSVSPRAIEALQAAVKAKGFDVAVGGSLYSDSLGGPDSGGETYIGAMTANVDAIVGALGHTET